ncbi:MAG: flagellar biosynthesis protein FlhA [Bacteroidetes bacterium]|nr:flagellar biosynthesis protein FlhA [Rhodothermia bacterium]MCS7154868.1 flagellar biosynthesis protein FlhA [Bacteroidota bacterium]MCX7906974.1 flagellar biosynthesis protein FlhA [Bacteroidota bacterium]MDW8137662.1 flagellar biosynthesis protein FlhA [Bacteroidota bacterium]MDW8285384.1 flagellar biosynthesis protein FlhA [Bacteroidota bacterium]
MASQSALSQTLVQAPIGLRGEGAIAGGIVLILLVMLVPLPSFLLDVLLALNISLSLLVLLVAFYTRRPLEFAVFPTLLLVLTLFRLSLNVASTRLILSQASAGAIIQAFGQFVVGGNYVVGLIIFLVLVIINFVVITKGSGRIAEVSARFTLDALPGKQMAIDADLNAGLIDDKEARRRREEIARESDFYGAMDGASKFVRGDAIAGLVITGINIVGGLAIGTLQMGMPLAEAASTYLVLTVGDGLVSQIPALLVSTAAGIIVSRAAAESNLAADFSQQLFGHPRVLHVAAAFLGVFGLIPGLPLVPFWLLALLLLLASHWSRRALLRAEAHRQQEAARELEAATAEAKRAERVQDYLLVDPLELEIGYNLIPLVDPNQKGDLLGRITTLRKQLAMELGIVIPPIRIRDNMQLEGNHYMIKLRGNPIGQGEILPGYYLALLPEELAASGSLPVQGIRTTDPSFGLPAIWINERHKEEAEAQGLTVVEAPAVITTHLLEVLRRNAYKLLDRQEVKKLIDNVREAMPALIEELVPNLLTIGDIQKVLKRLLREKVPIRDMVTILETLADYANTTKNVDVLTEYVRAALAPTITRQYRDEFGEVKCLTLDPSLEAQLMEHAQKGILNPNTLGFSPEVVEKIYTSASRAFRRMMANGLQPIVLTSPVLRPTLYQFLSPIWPDVVVLSYNDLTVDTQIKAIDRIGLQP